MPPKVEGPRGVAYVDGMHLGRKAVVLVASDDSHALGWRLCRAENSRAWSALMRRIAAPEMVVSGGGDGLQKALKETWPHAPRRRCVFHAFSQVKRDTTSRPRTQAGVELYGLAKAPPSITTLKEAQGWVGAFIAWSERWDGLLSEQTKTDDGKYVLTRERLVKARGSLARLISAGTLFAHLDPRLEHLAPPSTSSRIEGGVNSRLGGMLRDHGGLSVERGPKAIFWWRCMHGPSPLPAAGILRVMPAGSSIKAICERPNQSGEPQGAIPRRGDAIAWSGLHHPGPWRMDWG